MEFSKLLGLLLIYSLIAPSPVLAKEKSPFTRFPDQDTLPTPNPNPPPNRVQLNGLSDDNETSDNRDILIHTSDGCDGIKIRLQRRVSDLEKRLRELEERLK